jgi:hypothetical protein
MLRSKLLVVASLVMACGATSAGPPGEPVGSNVSEADAGTAPAADAATAPPPTADAPADDGGVPLRAPSNEVRLVSGDICGMTRDATRIYWVVRTNPGAAALQSMPISGGATTTLSASFPCTKLAANKSHLFGVVEGSGGTTVVRVPLGGGALETVTTESTGKPPVLRALVVDDTHVYWVSAAGVHRAPVGPPPTVGQLWLDQRFEGMLDDGTSVYGKIAPSTIARKAKAEGPTVVGATPLDLVCTPTATLGASDEFAVDATHVYGHDFYVGTVFKAPRGGSPTPIAGPYKRTYSVGSDAKTVFFTAYDDEEKAYVVGLLPKTGGPPITVPVEYGQGPFVIHDDYIFWWTTIGIFRMTR